MFLKTMLITLSCFLISCQKWTTVPKDRIVPNSIASADEQSLLQANVAEIQNLATTSGISKTFINFPIVVVDKSPTGNDPQAFCWADRKGNGVYIGILKKTFEAIKNEASFTENYLFLLLVHEFGHCLFNRKHEVAFIKPLGKKIYLQDHAGKRHDLWDNAIPITAMNSSTPGIMGGPYLTLALKRYYLLEIAGMKRWSTVRDLETVDGIALENK